MNETVRTGKKAIDILLLCMTFYEITVIPHVLFIGFKFLTLAYLLLKYILQSEKLIESVIAIAVYGIITVVSSVLNRMSLNAIVSSFFYAVQIMDIFLVTKSFMHSYDLDELVHVVFSIFIVLLLINDILMLFVNYDFADPAEEYFIGNKFVVAYLHCFASSLLFWKAKESGKTKRIGTNPQFVRKVVPFAFVIFSALICLKVTCTTGMIICLCLAVLMLLPRKLAMLFLDGRVVILITLVCNLLIFGEHGLYNNKYVADFIKNVLGKTYTWKGRLIIYEAVANIIREKPFMGHGYYSNVVTEWVSFAANPQNGVLKIIVDSGILGLAGYVLLVYFGLKSEVKDYSMWPFFAFLYSMVAASLVEINLSHMIIYMTIAMVYAQNSRKQKTEEK